jgi:hypothetical protein
MFSVSNDYFVLLLKRFTQSTLTMRVMMNNFDVEVIINVSCANRGSMGEHKMASGKVPLNKRGDPKTGPALGSSS